MFKCYVNNDGEYRYEVCPYHLSKSLEQYGIKPATPEPQGYSVDYTYTMYSVFYFYNDIKYWL